MKKILVILCAAAVLAGCGSKEAAPAETAPAETQAAEIANPWSDAKDLAEAAEISGVPFELQDQIGEYKVTGIRSMEGLTEIIYSDGKDELRVRKGTGTEDNSGDMNEYSENSTELLAGAEIEYQRSGKDGLVNRVWWTDGTYAWSMTSLNGIEPADISAIMKIVYNS
ncbi:MAG: membrane lipoprotein lipid attachment site-containing protein [Solobacterium sp.]|nr:membrane lipoprotein lipid attachment site-containing protein [Solobacterium sp.]